MKMNFERGIDPKKSLDIGLNHNGRIPEEGRSFLVQFLLKKSCPEFYPLQEKQRRGEPIVAICIGHPRLIYDPFTFNPHKFISLLRLNYFLDMTPQSVNNPNHFQHYSLSLLA